MEIILIGLINLYQKTLSPDHGFLSVLYPKGFCPFYPSCSEYAKQVLRKHGIFGIPKIIKRLSICRPGVNCRVDLP
jgi:uncharacterized protein